MTGKQRQTILLAVLGLILAYYAAEWVFQNMLEGPRQARIQRGEELQERIKQREEELSTALKAAQQLEAWEAQSLPSNPEIAVSLYRSWLTELVEYARFSSANVDVGSPMNRKGLYQSIDCSIRATATLEQLTTFLFEFYHAGHLHQIRSVNISPLPRRNELDLVITVEALVLPTADRKDELSPVRANRLAFSDLGDYRLIADRNLFGFTTQGVHETDQTFLTAIVQVQDQPQAWFTVRSTDRVLKLACGDQLAIGQFQGTVEEISGHDVIVESDDERWLMTIGDSLAQALALPPEY
jgi:hypothetical protein